jgi:transposase
MTYYVGVDVSKKKLDCAWLREVEKLKVKSKSIPNNLEGHAQLIGWLHQHVSHDLSEIHVVMEATSIYHEGLAYFLVAQGVRVSIANPARVRDFAKGLGMQHKTDKQDGLLLARYGALTQPALWEPEPAEIRELKGLLWRLSALEKDLQREVNRQDRAQMSGSSDVVLTSIRDMIAQLKQEIVRVKRQIDDHIDRHPGLKKDRELLETIPAIGPVLSRELLTLLRSRSFCNAGQAAAFVGLVPKLQESGQWKGRSQLSKKGSGQLRAKLYFAAVVGTRYNPDISLQYKRLLKNGKTKMQALGAAMRKLLQICFGVLKHQSRYQPQIS